MPLVGFRRIGVIRGHMVGGYFSEFVVDHVDQQEKLPEASLGTVLGEGSAGRGKLEARSGCLYAFFGSGRWMANVQAALWWFYAAILQNYGGASVSWRLRMQRFRKCITV